MGVIVSLKDGRERWFLEWSSIVDAPTTRGMKAAEMLAHLREQHGKANADEQSGRIDRARRLGTSTMPEARSAESIVSGNRAGPEELSLSRSALVAMYCRGMMPDLSAKTLRLLRLLSEWLRGGENIDGDLDPAVLVSIDPFAPGGVACEVRSNHRGRTGTKRFVITDALKPAALKALLRASVVSLRGPATKGDGNGAE